MLYRQTDCRSQAGFMLPTRYNLFLTVNNLID